MRYRFLGAVTWLIAASALVGDFAAPAQSKTRRTAYATVSNLSPKTIKVITLVHKYSDVYKEYQSWANLPIPSTTSKMPVSYNTGFGTTGVDWWRLFWEYSDGTVCMTNPKNLQGPLNKVEKFALKNAAKYFDVLAGQIAGAASAPLGPLGQAVAGSAAGKVAGNNAEVLAQALFNEESTAGFKKHMLRKKDEEAVTSIAILPGDLVTLVSNSGRSTTRYKCEKP